MENKQILRRDTEKILRRGWGQGEGPKDKQKMGSEEEGRLRGRERGILGEESRGNQGQRGDRNQGRERRGRNWVQVWERETVWSETTQRELSMEAGWRWGHFMQGLPQKHGGDLLDHGPG